MQTAFRTIVFLSFTNFDWLVYWLTGLLIDWLIVWQTTSFTNVQLAYDIMLTYCAGAFDVAFQISWLLYIGIQVYAFPNNYV